MRSSKIWLATVHAYESGYRVNEDGKPVNPKGKVLSGYLSDKPHSYRAISIKHDGRSRKVPIHVICAIQTFGIDAVANAPHVRHLDGNAHNNCPNNIGIGTASDNSMDQPPEVRASRARHASRSIRRKDWSDIESDKHAGMSYRQLASKYNMSKGTLAYHFSNTATHRSETNR